MDWIVAFISFVLPLLATVEGQPVLMTTNQTFYSKVGSFISMDCRIRNLTATDKLNWVFVKHDKLIFHGNQLMVDDPRYTWLHIPATDSYYLRIFPANIGDQGIYKCEIDGTKQVGIIELTLDDPDALPDVSPPVTPLNKTGCCLQQGVASACIPACYPSSAPDGVNMTAACLADLPKLIYCGTDGRNHENCCARSGVPSSCLMMCNYKEGQLQSIGSDEAHCLSYTDKFISCYEFGGALLPSPPQNLSVLTSSRNGTYALLINWRPPQYNADAVTGYIVHYKKMSDNKFQATKVLHAASHDWSLPADINTYYSLYVTAVGHHGASQPTNRFEIVVEDNSPPGHAKNVLACCQDRKVPSFCQSLLCHPTVWSTFNVGHMVQCFSHLNDVYSCLNGERNNTGCCQVNNVPDHCVGMCSGSPPPFKKSLAFCVPKLPVIEACVQRGLSTQPAPPQGLVLTDVTAHEAFFSWTAPNASSGPPVNLYLVQLRRGNKNADWDNVETVAGTYTDLWNLTETENYAVRLISLTDDKTSSLPSASLRFTTYPETTRPEMPIITHDVKKCCIESGMPNVCAEGCQYVENITSYYLGHIDACRDFVGTVLTCAADGRDHTSCCRQRQVQEQCLELCVYDTPGTLDERLLSCIEDTSRIITCFREGLEDLVRKPDNVTVTNVTSHTITLQWDSPRTGPRPDHFIVDYTNLMNNTASKGTTQIPVYILQDLTPGSKYTMTVTSFRSNTYSPPTQSITYQTPSLDTVLPFDPATPTNTSRALWNNRTHCCQTNDISSMCQPLCLNQITVNATDCSTENHNILTCAADGRDHSPCCQANGLPDECLPFCSSHASSSYSVTLAGCLADYSLNIITSCFLSNTGLLPSVPFGFRVRKDYGRSITLLWMPASNCDKNDCTYDAHYWRYGTTDPTAYQTVPNVTSPYTMTSLIPGVRYVFTITAHNSDGSGPAAPWHTLYFDDLIPKVYIIQHPRRDVHEHGTNIYLTCDTYNFMEAPTYIWKLRDRTLDNKGRTLVLSQVDEFSEGNYTCMASAPGIKIEEKIYVNVRFKPVLAYFRVDSARPNVGAEAVLACWYRGHPSISNVHNVWTKDEEPIPKTYHTSRSAKSRLHTGITAFRLKIKNVVRSDYGTYRCNVSNQHGRIISKAVLRDPDKTPTLTPPTTKEKQNITNCCKKAGVLEFCLSMCTFEMNMEEIFKQPQRYGICIIFFKEFVRCTADGADHTLCCQKEVVHKQCLPFCRGVVPHGNNTLCIEESPAILNCAAKGYEKIPTAPQNLVASFVDSKIKLAWDKPLRNADRVTGYVIHYNNTGYPEPMTETFTDKHGLSYILKNASNQHVYYIWMASEAYDIGRSQFTDVITVSPYGSEVPLPPERVIAESIGTTGFIRWSAPPQQSSHAESFAVYYKPLHAALYNMKFTTDYRITLRGLMPDTTYTVSIASRNMKGEGAKSTRVTFLTGQKGASEAQEQTGGNLSGGQIAGVVLAMITVVGVLIVIAVFLIRSRVPKQGVSETVSFENPGYGNQQQVHIGSLPENNPYDSVMQPQVQGEKDGNFGYARLNEDHAAAAAEMASGTTASTSASNADYPNTQYDNVVEAKAITLEVTGDGGATGSNDVAKDESYT